MTSTGLGYVNGNGKGIAVVAPSRRQSPPQAVGVGVVIVALLVGCSAADDGPDDAEVAGAVLERDAQGRPLPAEDLDETPGADDTGADDAVTDASDADDAADDPETDQLDDGGASEGDATETPADPDEPAPPTPAPPSSTDPLPATPAPNPPAPPRPRALAAGSSSPGIALGFGDDDTETSSVTLEREAPALVSDAVRAGTDDRVGCATRLQAPDDRALTAKGTLRVGLVIDLRDGSVKRVPRQLVELDVHVAAGEVHELPASRAYAFDRTTVAGIACEAVFQPQ